MGQMNARMNDFTVSNNFRVSTLKYFPDGTEFGRNLFPGSASNLDNFQIPNLKLESEPGISGSKSEPGISDSESEPEISEFLDMEIQRMNELMKE